jgi:putative ABC transport system ATP-binding protein
MRALLEQRQGTIVTSTSGSILSAGSLRKEYGKGAALVRAVDDVSLEVAQGESVAIVGPSGCGKSTLLYLLGGLERPTSGTFQLAQRRLEDMPEAGLARLRRRALGFVFQAFHLVDELTALENVELPVLLARASPRKARARATDLLEQVGLEDRAEHLPSALSGDNASASRSRARSPTNRRLFWPMNPPGTSTARRRPRCSACSINCTRMDRRWSWSPTTSGSRRRPTA